jgi:hypothetical protein
MTVQSDWLGRLFAFFQAPNIQKMVATYSVPIQDTRDAVDYLLAQDSIDMSTGQVLDFYGELIGVDRPPAQEIEDNILWMCRADEMDTDPDGSRSLAPADSSSGGYMTGSTGVPSRSAPGTYLSDADYRVLIRAKASTYRSKMIPDNLFNYLIIFGIRALLEETQYGVSITPETYDDLNYWVRDYVISRGYHPAGITNTLTPQEVTE